MADQWNNLRDARFLLDEDTRPLNPVPPVILTTPEEWRRWLTAPVAEALQLQRPLPAGMLQIVAEGVREDAA